MTRRDFGVLAGGAAVAADGMAAAKRPNFVVIFADDLGWGDLGCYGHPTVRTPNLDAMALGGVRFTQFYVAAPACSPSRAALMTGRLPQRAGVPQVLNPWDRFGLPDSEVTVAAELKKAGYRTACVGKWHLGHLPEYLPTRRGFDRYFGIPYSNDMSAKWANANYLKTLAQHPEVPGTPLMRDEKVVETEPEQSVLTERYTKEAVGFIRESAKAKAPFFLYLPHSMPHYPISASPRFKGKSARGLYGDVIEELDWSVGEIRRTLRELKIEKETLVVFSSDNGPWLIKGLDGGSAGLLREGKATHWEGGFRVPGIFEMPGTVRAGVTEMQAASTMDLLPTMLGMAGVALPKVKLDGADLRGVLVKGERRGEFRMLYYNGRVLKALRKGPWKLIVGPKPELYQLEHDPSEKYDLAGEEPAVVKALLQDLEADDFVQKG